MKPANHAPVYAAMYSELSEFFRSRGYALAIHGSLIKDFDLIAVPWVPFPKNHKQLLTELEKEFALKVLSPGTLKPCNRIAYSIVISHGECAIDLSFTGGSNG